jgi:hypothetical protein
VFADDGIARKARRHHLRDQGGKIIVPAHDGHLRARDHDFLDMHLGDVEHALQHAQGIGIEEAALLPLAQDLHQFVTIVGRNLQQIEQTLPPGSAGRSVGTGAFIAGGHGHSGW